MINTPFGRAGQWYKGNLHTHSNQSDGEPSPQQIVDIYAESGYDFLAITDHNQLTDVSSLETRGLLLIPGSEINGGTAELGQQYHVVALGLRKPVEAGADNSIQEIIDASLAAGEVCWVAHPGWSSLTSRDLQDLQGHLGIEVYNTTCHHGIGRGESSVQWDELLARGQHLLGLAVDDAHWHYPDAIGGWVMVRAEACTQPEILQALREGSFYATNGPLIHDLRVTDGKLHIQCSPATEVRLINPLPGRGLTTWRLANPGPFTETYFPVPNAATVVRVEVVDSQGRKAWSNPFRCD